MPAVLARHPDAQLILAGQGETAYVNFLRQRATELGVEHSIKFVLRYIPVRDIPLLYGAADVVAMPYWNASQSGALFTAAAFDAPVVATRVGGLATILKDGENGLLVEPKNVEQLQEALLRMLAMTDDARTRMANNLKSWVMQNCSWGDIATQTIEAYRRAVHHKGASSEVPSQRRCQGSSK